MLFRAGKLYRAKPNHCSSKGVISGHSIQSSVVGFGLLAAAGPDELVPAEHLRLAGVSIGAGGLPCYLVGRSISD